MEKTMPVVVLVNGEHVHLSGDQVEKYEIELIGLEKRLEESTHTEFWSVGSYLTYCKDNGASDRSIQDELRQEGFEHLTDKYGLAYIRQIYLPRLEAECRCGR